MEQIARGNEVSAKDSLLRIAACSYEGSLFGWNVVENEEGEGLDTKMGYGFNCSTGSLKSVAVSTNGKYLACGGMEERIKVFNVVENKSMGELSMHTGAITCLQFFEDSYLLSGSEDSTLCIWRCHDWSCVHVLAGHKGPVNAVSVHPSGKLALSVSKDNTMKMWNLVHGRCAFTRRLRGPADKVLWHPSGELYMLVVGSEIQLYQASDNACLATIKHKTRVNQAVYTVCGAAASSSTTNKSSIDNESESAEEKEAVVDKNFLRVAAVCEDKMLYFYDLQGQETAKVNLDPLGGRPRDMWSSPLVNLSTSTTDTTTAAAVAAAACGPNISDDIREVLADEGHTLTIATSTGRIAILSSKAIEQGVTAFEEASLCSTEVRAEPRLTAIVSWSTHPNSSESKKRRYADREEEEEDDDDDDSDLDSEEDDGSENGDDGNKKVEVVEEEKPKPKKGGKPVPLSKDKGVAKGGGKNKNNRDSDDVAGPSAKKQKLSAGAKQPDGSSPDRRKSVSFTQPPGGKYNNGGGGKYPGKDAGSKKPYGAAAAGGRPGQKFGGGDKFSKGGDKFSKGGDNFSKGGDKFSKGGDKFSKGGDKFSKGGDKFSKGGDKFSKGGYGGKGGDKFSKGGDKFSKGGDKFSKGGYGKSGGHKGGGGKGKGGGKRF